MSFYHILLSNAAVNRFPSNRAATFSTPIDNVQHLNGEWEVGISQLVHSNCIYTFDHEVMTIKSKLTDVIQCEKGCRVYIPQWSKKESVNECKRFVYEYLNKVCKGIVEFTPDKGEYSFGYHKVDKDWIVALVHI